MSAWFSRADFDFNLPLLPPHGLEAMLGAAPGCWLMDVRKSRPKPLRLFKRDLLVIDIWADTDGMHRPSHAAVSASLRFRHGRLSEGWFTFRGDDESTTTYFGGGDVMSDLNTVSEAVAHGMMRFVDDVLSPSGRIGRAVRTYLSDRDGPFIARLLAATSELLRYAGVHGWTRCTDEMTKRRCLSEWRTATLSAADRVRVWIPRLVALLVAMSDRSGNGTL